MISNLLHTSLNVKDLRIPRLKTASSKIWWTSSGARSRNCIFCRMGLQLLFTDLRGLKKLCWSWLVIVSTGGWLWDKVQADYRWPSGREDLERVTVCINDSNFFIQKWFTRAEYLNQPQSREWFLNLNRIFGCLERCKRLRYFFGAFFKLHLALHFMSLFMQGYSSVRILFVCSQKAKIQISAF